MDRVTIDNQIYRSGRVLYQPSQELNEPVSVHQSLDGHEAHGPFGGDDRDHDQAVP